MFALGWSRPWSKAGSALTSYTTQNGTMNLSKFKNELESTLVKMWFHSYLKYNYDLSKFKIGLEWNQVKRWFRSYQLCYGKSNHELI